MRVLKVSDVYFPRVNGVSTSIQTFTREFRGAGHEVALVVPDYGVDSDDEHDIHRVPSRRVVVDPEDRMLEVRRLLALAPVLRARGFDIVHVHTPFIAHYAGLALARRLGLPCVASYHTYFEEYLHCYLPWLPRALLRFAARRFSRRQCEQVDAVIAPTPQMRDALRAYGVRNRIEIIATGIDARRFRDGDGARFRAAHGIPAQRPVLVHVGRLAHEKNIGFLLRVLVRVREAVPEVLMVIAGEGPAAPHLRREVSALGLAANVLFCGYLARENGLNDCYLAGDAFVFASRTETQGLVLIEAMALGLPVVSTAVMGSAHVLRHARGALVPREEIGEFAAAVVRVLRDDELRARLSLEAMQSAAEWSAAVLAARMLELYADVIARRGICANPVATPTAH